MEERIVACVAIRSRIRLFPLPTLLPVCNTAAGILFFSPCSNMEYQGRVSQSGCFSFSFPSPVVENLDKRKEKRKSKMMHPRMKHYFFLLCFMNQRGSFFIQIPKWIPVKQEQRHPLTCTFFYFFLFSGSYDLQTDHYRFRPVSASPSCISRLRRRNRYTRFIAVAPLSALFLALNVCLHCSCSSPHAVKMCVCVSASSPFHCMREREGDLTIRFLSASPAVLSIFLLPSCPKEKESGYHFEG